MKRLLNLKTSTTFFRCLGSTHLSAACPNRRILTTRVGTPPVAALERGDEGKLRYEDMYRRLLQLYIVSNGDISANDFQQDILKTGLTLNDPRLQSTLQKIEDSSTADGYLSPDSFVEAVSVNIPLIEKVLSGKTIIPEFQTFKEEVDSIYNQCISNREGEVANYIPALADVNPDLWGLSLCTIDGQRHSVGDSQEKFTIQSGGKCFSYAVSVDEYGAEKIHSYVGKEPSGKSFNSLVLNDDFKPHNPMINAGALMLSSLVKSSLSITERVNFMLRRFCEMAGLPERSLKCDITTCDSEMETAHRNYALLHYMKSMGVFPEEADLETTLKFYTRMCSIEVDCESGAVMAGTLANAGICPITGKRVVGLDTVRNTLTLMHSCGMYDSAGEFSFAVGLPAKSGVSGVIILVVPNVMGLCLYSPRVNKSGNSLRGLQFSESFVNKFNFHNYDSLLQVSSKVDPRRRKSDHKELEITSIMYAAHAGALSSMERYMMAGVDLSQCNYDGRTPLHIAAAEGHQQIVQHLITKARVSINTKDRWGHTPLDEAHIFGHSEAAKYLISNGAVTGAELDTPPYSHSTAKVRS